ncbi:MAG TPA: nidogen-like domain-containing protein, partial [Acidimicrobiales bacterium]
MAVALTLAIVALPALAPPASAVTATAVLSGYNTTSLGRSDDGSYPCTSTGQGTPTGCTPSAVPIGFPIDFFGTTYSNLYVNNNGNLTFGSSLASYTPFGLAGTSSVIIAPFFADVDTRVGNVTAFGTGTVNGHPAFGVTWPGVGCFSETDSVTDNFQAVLIDRSDIAPGDFDIEYNYNSIQWDAGQDSGGNNTCQGTNNSDAAAVGYSNGTGAAGTNFELAGSQADGALLDSNATTGLTGHNLNANADAQGAGVLGRYIFQVRAGTPLNPTTTTTSLSGGSQHGATISVPPSTPTTDAAGISGASSTAGGTVTYSVYSDANCTTQVGSGGTQPVVNDTATASNAVTLPTPGTYYWQASYSGDAANEPSTSMCGTEVENVVNPVALSVSKTVSPNPYTPGSALTYTITVSNAGPGTAAGTAVSDPLPSALSGGGFTWSCAATAGSTCGSPSGTGSITDSPTIAAAGHVVYTLTGTVPAATTGTLSNTATVTPPTGTTDPGCSPNCSDTATDAQAAPALKLVKSASVTSVSAAGSTFTYTFAVQNTGNTNLSDIAIHDNQTAPSVSGNLTNLSCPSPSLASGVSENCTATYTVSQPDMDAGSINDTATATGAFGSSTITSNQSAAAVSAAQGGAITITKSASASSLSAPGNVIYTFTVQNTGNVDLSSVTVADAASFSGLSAITCGTNTNGSFSLAPGASATCTATEAVNQGAIDAGASLVDTASVSANTPSSDTTTPTVNASSQAVTVTIAQSSTLTLTKSASVTSVSAAGATFTYSFLVTNTGNTDESSITIHDTQTPPSVASDLTNLRCPNASLAPGIAETCTATYTVSQADMDAGSINDAATATGTVGNATITSNSSKAAVTAAQGGAITLTKTAS